KLLQQIYPQFLSALRWLGSLERAHTVQAALEESLRCLPLPTIILRWNLRLVYQNRAARGFCTVWKKGLKEARLTKACSPVPPEILDRCRQLKQQWARAKRPNAPPTLFKEERVRHPRSPHLRATIRVKQLNLAGIARPDFLIQCENLRRKDTSHAETPDSRLWYFVQLTGREQEVARLICDGQSNQEIADEAGLSLATVKQH